MIAYRLFQIRDGKPTTLFHGVHGSRTLPLGKWIEAEVEEVFDGTDGTRYQSGFHVSETKEEATGYLKHFQQPRPIVISAVRVEDTWPKEHSQSDIILARHMKIPRSCWLVANNPLNHPTIIKREKIAQKRETALAGYPEGDLFR